MVKRNYLFSIVIILFFSAVLVSEARGTTVITNDITADTTWDLAGSVYWIQQPISISSSSTLTIEPGVIVKLQRRYGRYTTMVSITVNGQLELPSSGDPVIFTSERDDTVGGDTNGDGTATSPSNGDWGFIKFNSDGNTFENAVVRYGGISHFFEYSPQNRYMVWCNQTNPVIDNCVISNAYQNALYYNADQSAASTVSITDSEFYGSSNSVYVVPASAFVTDVTITGCDVSGESNAIYINGSSGAPPELTITNNTVSSSSQEGNGINLNYPSETSVISNNTIQDVLQGIVVTGGSPSITGNDILDCAEFPLTQIDAAFPLYSGNTITGNAKQAIRVNGTIGGTGGTWVDVQSLPYHVEDGSITVGGSATLSIDPGVVVKFERKKGRYDTCRSLIVNGMLELPATGDRITFTSERDDTVGGDSNGDGAGTSPEAGNWGYIRLNSSGNHLRNAEIRYGGIEKYFEHSPQNKFMIWNNGTVNDLDNLILKNAYDVAIYYDAIQGEASDVSINNSQIEGCPRGIRFESSTNFITDANINYNTVIASTYGINVAGASGARPILHMYGNNVSSPGGTSNGVYLSYPDSSSVIEGNNIHDNLQGLLIEDGSPQVYENTIIDNYEFPMSHINSAFPVYAGNNISGNEKQAIRVYGTISSDGTWKVIQGMGLPYHVEDGSITIASGATLSVKPGVVIKFERMAGRYATCRSMIVDGLLNCQGEAWNKIYFTSERDDSVGGDSNGDGTATSPGAGNWGYIRFDSSGNTLQHSVIRYGGIEKYFEYSPQNTYMVWANNQSTTIRHCVFEHAYNIALYYVAYPSDDSTGVIYHNEFYDSSTGIYFNGSPNFDTKAKITFNRVQLGGGGGRGIFLKNVSAASTVNNNHIRDNQHGVYVDGAHGAFEIANNNIVGNSGYGVRVGQAPCVVADNNWWGAADGPLDEETGAGECDGTNAGSGDEISEYVECTLWSDEELPIGLLDCSDAVDVQCGDTLSFESNDDGTMIVDSYSCDPDLNENGMEKVYVVTMTTSQSLQVHLEPWFDTDPDVFILGSCTEENCLAHGDFDAILETADAGTYYIVVDSSSTEPAYYDLTVLCGAPTFTPTNTPTPEATPTPQPNLDCSQIISLSCNVPYTGNTMPGESNVSSYPDCNSINFSGPEIVHQVVTLGVGDMEISLDTDDNLAFLVLSSCSEWHCIYWGIDELVIPNAPPSTYYIVVDGVNGDAGSYTLLVNCEGSVTTATPTRTPTVTPTGTGTAYTPTPTDIPTVNPLGGFILLIAMGLLLVAQFTRKMN